MRRAQASITVVEAGLGVLLLLTMTVAFALGVPDAGAARTQAQLDTYATDGATLLSTEPPRHGDQTRLAEVAESRAAFERERAALRRRIDRILPPNLLFQLDTPQGTVGYRKPDDVQTGSATILTKNGAVTLRVWYA